MILSYEEFSERVVRIWKKGNTPYVKCYRCGDTRIVGGWAPSWYNKYYTNGCLKCKEPQLYLRSNKKTRDVG